MNKPYDFGNVRPEKIKLAIVGRSDSVDKILEWLERCKSYVPGKESKQPNLYKAFPGFNSSLGFCSELVYDEGYIRKINNSDFEGIFKHAGNYGLVVKELADLYLTELKYLSKNKRPDVVICVLSEKVFATTTAGSIESGPTEPIDEEDEDEQYTELENDFRRLLKARAMAYNVPIQIVRDKVADAGRDMQDPATIAWNFFTALYYKASGTPWALTKSDSSITCFAGISFYRSRDKKTVQTSVTQIFNEHGKGVILRGSPIKMKKGDKEPHLNEEQAYQLLSKSLKEYYEALKIYPKRLVIHKSSNYSIEEIEGFKAVAFENRINALDLVTIMSSSLRLYANSNYPPNRGSMASYDEKNHLLYSRGYVDYYGTYPGSYIPNPIEIRVIENDESPDKICQEILALSKMNWNNSQFDRKYPITIDCSRKVGEIMKYLDEDEIPQIRYSYYM